MITCPKCGSENILVREVTSYFINTDEFFCHSHKTYDDDAPCGCLNCDWEGIRKALTPDPWEERFTWKRKGGYEVSSKGDKRFSAFNARLLDGRTIEEHYQCDIKGYDVGGTNWRLGKGKPPLVECSETYLWDCYLSLWRVWASNNIPLMRELYKEAKKRDNVLSDCFASSDINQARALATILNELAEKRDD